jgi:hypothetical protein
MLITEGWAPPGKDNHGHVAGTQHQFGKALDVKLTGDNSVARQAEFIRDASAIGFNGIGAYGADKAMHIDIRDDIRAWGPTTHSDSIDNLPQPIAKALKEHISKRGGASINYGKQVENYVQILKAKEITPIATSKPLLQSSGDIGKYTKNDEKTKPIQINVTPQVTQQTTEQSQPPNEIPLKNPKNKDSGLDKWYKTLIT